MVVGEVENKNHQLKEETMAGHKKPGAHGAGRVRG
jgi:hypothetical protein